MEKSSLVKLSDKKADRSNRFSLRGNVFKGRMGFDSVKILNQIPCMGDFLGKKISLVEGKENRMVNGADGRGCGDSAGSDFLCQCQFPEGSLPETVEVPCDGSQQAPV